MEIPVSKGHPNKLLKHITKGYLKDNGYSGANLDKYKVHILDSANLKAFRRKSRPKNSNKVIPYTGYVLEALESSGHVVRTSDKNSFYLSPKGFIKGAELLHPIKTFYSNHW